MIEEISISNLGVIGEARLPLGPGFTALTGETGAGKTMVVSALGLLLGERADSAAIRSGSQQAVVEGRWLIDDAGPVADRVRDAGGELDAGELILGRSVSVEGRSRAVVGGRSAPVGVLNEIGEQLVVVHGQSDQVRLAIGHRAARGARSFRRRGARDGARRVRDRVPRLAGRPGRARRAGRRAGPPRPRGGRAARVHRRDRGRAAPAGRGPGAHRARRPAGQPRRPAGRGQPGARHPLVGLRLGRRRAGPARERAAPARPGRLARPGARADHRSARERIVRRVGAQRAAVRLPGLARRGRRARARDRAGAPRHHRRAHPQVRADPRRRRRPAGHRQRSAARDRQRRCADRVTRAGGRVGAAVGHRAGRTAQRAAPRRRRSDSATR